MNIDISDIGKCIVHFTELGIIMRASTNTGLVVHTKGTIGFESVQEFNIAGLEIHYKASDGRETWTEYDNENNLIHEKQIKY